MLVARSSRATGPKNTGAAEFAGVVKQHAGVVVEADIRAVGTADFLLGAHDNCLRYSAFLYVRRGDYTLHRNYDDVAHRGVAATGATQHVDAQCLFCSAVVCNG